MDKKQSKPTTKKTANKYEEKTVRELRTIASKVSAKQVNADGSTKNKDELIQSILMMEKARSKV